MKFRERTEIIEFNEKNVETITQTQRIRVRLFFENILLQRYKRKYAKLVVGSEKWHKNQELVSKGHSVGFQAKLRILFYTVTLPKCGENLYVHPGTIFYYPHNLYIGDNVYLNRNVFITARAKITIGDNVLIGPNTVMNSGNHLYSDPKTPICLQGHISKEIIIEDDVWIGANTTILCGVKIGKGSVIAAGSVVNRDVPPYSVVAGVPARKVRDRM